MIRSTTKHTRGHHRSTAVVAGLLFSLTTLFSPHKIFAAPDTLTEVREVEALKVETIGALPTMADSVSALLQAANSTLKSKPPKFKLQEVLINATGSAAGQTFALYQSSNQTRNDSRQAKEILLNNRELLLQLLTHNEKLIRHYQEHELDNMSDPVAFFESEQWQMPQKLISLASYWLGWNNYYASLLMQPEEPLRKTVLDEAVEAFSRSFIDFAEDEITTKSLYGRALIYKQQKVYGRSAYDFRSVKQRLDHSHPLYLDSLFQEALISHEQGNDGVVRGIIKSIRSNYLSKDIPDSIRIGIKKIETQMIVESNEPSAIKPPQSAKNSSQISTDAPGTDTKSTDTLADADLFARFQRLKKIASNDPELFDDLYQFSRKHSDRLAQLNYAELSPVAALAVADNHFNRKQFPPALSIYQRLANEKNSIISARMDGVILRTAYIYNDQKQWKRATALLKDFSQNFPSSSYLKAVAELYYSAAISQHGKLKSSTSHQTYLQAARNYIAHCPSCSQLDDAYYALGRHLMAQGKQPEALAYYSEIGSESEHYFIALFHIADAQVAALEQLQQQNQLDSSAALKRYRRTQRLLNIYRSNGRNDNNAAQLKPNWLLLLARYDLLNITPNYARAIATLDQYDSQFIENSPTAIQHRGTLELQSRARAVRAIAFQRLNETAQFQSVIQELSRLSLSTNSGEQGAISYRTLQRLGDRFFSDPNPKTQNNSYTAAIHLYQQLTTISAGDDRYTDHLNGVSFRLGELYRRTNQFPKAVEIYQQLSRQNPDSADALFALADTYDGLSQWKQSLEIWRQLSDGLDAGSDRWFEVRYKIARTMQKLQRAENACAIAKMTRVLHPNLENTLHAKPLAEIERNTCQE